MTMIVIIIIIIIIINEITKLILITNNLYEDLYPLLIAEPQL